MALALLSDSICVKFAVLVVAAALLESCLGAPTPTDDHWWFRPCDTDISKIRHSRSASKGVPKNIQRQLNSFVMKLKETKRKIEKIYKSAKPKHTAVNLNWLSINKLIKNINNTKSYSEKIQTFNVALQYFAEVLEKLGRVQVRTGHFFNQTERDNIYENITYQMRTLLCEVYVENKIPTKKKPRIGMTIPTAFEDSFTGMRSTDITFFRKTYKFFRQVKRLFSKRRGKKSARNSAKSKKVT